KLLLLGYRQYVDGDQRFRNPMIYIPFFIVILIDKKRTIQRTIQRTKRGMPAPSQRPLPTAALPSGNPARHTTGTPPTHTA
uniref:hypothetical protein n=1 Tax=Serratia quinivorans TaxID=137545 RepID=UPI0035C76E4D